MTLPSKNKVSSHSGIYQLLRKALPGAAGM
jgi:hypothetical protein